jgi:hypothetical protein
MDKVVAFRKETSHPPCGAGQLFAICYPIASTARIVLSPLSKCKGEIGKSCVRDEFVFRAKVPGRPGADYTTAESWG